MEEKEKELGTVSTSKSKQQVPSSQFTDKNKFNQPSDAASSRYEGGSRSSSYSHQSLKKPSFGGTSKFGNAGKDTKKDEEAYDDDFE